VSQGAIEKSRAIIVQYASDTVAAKLNGRDDDGSEACLAAIQGLSIGIAT
jgi:hypothetical protein